MHGQCLATKFFSMAHGVLANQDAIGVSDDVFGKIKDLKIKTKKELIKSNAEIELISVDIMAKMWDRSPNLTEINALIDKKSDVKKAEMKVLAAAFIGLKQMLTKEQLIKVFGMCKGEKPSEGKENSCCR